MKNPILDKIKRGFCSPLSTPYSIVVQTLGFFLLFYLFSFSVRRQWDFAVYYLALTAFFTNNNPYSTDQLLTLKKNVFEVLYGGLPYLYSPLFILYFSFIYLLPLFPAAFMWIALKCFLLEIIIYLTLSLIRAPINVVSLCLMHIAVLLYRPIAEDINTGNVVIIEYSFIMLFVWAWHRNKEFLSGIALGFSGIFKLFPYILFLYLLHIRKFKILYGLMVFLGCSILLLAWNYPLFQHWLQFFTGPEWKQIWDDQLQGYFNSSYASTFLRIFNGTYLDEAIIYIPWLTWPFIILFPLFLILSFLFLHNKSATRAENYRMNSHFISLLILFILLINPRLSGYTMVYTFFPACLLLYTSFIYKKWGYFLLIICALILIQMKGYPEHYSHKLLKLLIDKIFWGALLLYIVQWIFYYKSLRE